MLFNYSLGSGVAPYSASPTGQSASIPASGSGSSFSVSSSSASLPAALQKGWSKQNLKNGERSGWTRGRDGWSPVIGTNASTGAKGLPGVVDGNGEVRFVLLLRVIKY